MQEYIRKDVPTSKTPDNSFSIVRHFVPSLYAIPAGVGALALGWERTAQSEFEPKLGTPQEVWNVLAWIAFATFVLCVLIHVRAPCPRCMFPDVCVPAALVDG